MVNNQLFDSNLHLPYRVHLDQGEHHQKLSRELGVAPVLTVLSYWALPASLSFLGAPSYFLTKKSN